MIRKLRKHFLKLFIAWVVLMTTLVLFVLMSGFLVDKIYRYTLSYLEENLQSKVEMSRPEISWLKGSWYIKDLSIRPRHGKEKREFISAKSVRISFLPWWNVLNREIGISSIQLEVPALYLRIEKGEIANLPALDFLKKGEKGMFKFALREVRVSSGKMALEYPERASDMLFSKIDIKIRPDFDRSHYGFFLRDTTADIKYDGLAEKIVSLKGDFSITPKNLTLIKGYIAVPEGNLSVEGFYMDLAASRWNMKASSASDLSVLKKAARGRAPWVVETLEKLALGGKADISVTADGDKKEFNADIRVRSRAIELAGAKISDIDSRISARFRAGRRELDISSLTAGIFGGSLRGKVSLDLGAGKSFNGKAWIKNIDLKGLSSSLRGISQAPLPDIVGKASGDIDISGKFMHEPRIDGSTSLQIKNLGISHGELFAAKAATAGIKSQISYSGGVVTIMPSVVETPSSTVSVSGDIAGKNLSLEMMINSSSLDELNGRIKGTGVLKLKVSGSVEDPWIDGNLDMRRVSWDRYHADAVSGNISFKERTISSTGLAIRHGGSGISLNGKLSLSGEAPGLDAMVELKNGRLEDLVSLAGIDIEARGNVSLKGAVKGPVSAPDGEFSVTGSEMAIMGEEIDSLSIGGVVEKGKFQIKRGDVIRNGEWMTVDGNIDSQGEMSINISSSSISLGSLHGVKRNNLPLRGTVGLDGQITGNIKDPSFEGRGVISGVTYKDIPLGNGELEISMVNRALIASGNLFSADLAGVLRLEGNYPFAISLNTEDLSLLPYFGNKANLHGLTGSLSGRVEAAGELSRFKDISASAYISDFQIARAPFLLKNAKEIELELVDRKVNLKSLQLIGRGTKLAASGWIGIDGNADLEVNGNINLFLLELFTEAINKGDGIADISMTISGKPLKLDGKVVLRNGTLGFRDFDSVFQEIYGAVSLKKEALLVESFVGKVGGGRFKGEGVIEMAGLGIKRTDMTFDISDVRLAYPRWLQSEVKGNLRLTGAYPSLLLSGEINVVKASYGERMDWAALLPSFRERLREPQTRKEGEGLLKLDINFRADRNLIFENNVGKGEFKGEVRLKGDSARFGVVGAVEVITGKVFYKEHEFNITSGVIEFPDHKKIEPVFDFTAEGKVRDYTVQILVQGNINDLKVTMTSSPPLSELDIASLLSFGLTVEEFQERGGGAPVYGAVSILSREVEDKFKDYMGVDRFRIDPYYSKVTGTSEPKLTVGKDLADDIILIYSRGLSGTGEQEVQMEYKLYRNFSLLGGWSSFGASQSGDLGADMKFRFEFR